ncbi:MAG: hypothetical protein ACM3PT_07595 [Deltaproteobacteria bacterium]
MAITYDKYFLKWYSTLDQKRIRKAAIRNAIIHSINYPVLLIFFDFVINNFKFNLGKTFLYLFVGLIIFVIFYFREINEIRKQRKTYDESVKYFKEHDPDFIESIIGKI